ncbi:MAG: hypothetical protein ACLFQH_08780, partial [Halothiobacillaceae bacterium]
MFTSQSDKLSEAHRDTAHYIHLIQLLFYDLRTGFKQGVDAGGPKNGSIAATGLWNPLRNAASRG